MPGSPPRLDHPLDGTREFLAGNGEFAIMIGWSTEAYRWRGLCRFGKPIQTSTHEHYRSVLERYRSMQEKIARRLRQIREEDVRRLVFYGAGQVLEVTCPLARKLGLEVVGVVDDDPAKQGEERGGFEVSSPECLRELRPDAVLITTCRHADEIRGRLEGGLPEGARVLEL